MQHYINDNTGKVYGYKADNTREMTCEEFQAHCNQKETIDECRCKKLTEMRVDCGKAIDAGFDCDVLGYPCQYRNTTKDQLRMQSASLLNGGNIWRNEKLTLHTKEQAEVVFAESHSEIDRHTVYYEAKCSYVSDPSRTAEEISAVTWDSNE